MALRVPAPTLGLLVTWLTLIIIQACAQRQDGQFWLSCPPNPGLDRYSYYIDFTNPPADMSKDWSTSNYATITYNTKGKNGAEFTFAKRYDAPQLFTNFYIFFGRVDVEMQVAPGTGIISSSVLLSDDFDEIDWEMSGNNFNLNSQYPNGVVQNNYFSKGITGSYDRGQWIPCNKPQTTFHTYSFDWTPTKLDWLIDGKVVRTFLAANADTTTHQFPQTPSKIQLGLWDGGDPSQNQGTMNWAGGITNIADAPFTMFVKSVRITNYNPAEFYNWTDQSGSWKSIKTLNTSLPLPSSATTTTKTTTVAVQMIKSSPDSSSPKGTPSTTLGKGTPTAVHPPGNLPHQAPH
ncbi:concanavalin A-like lectin/glucanase domain-containing protein [Xylariaceae sp. FL0662B]|nr:concanavalin A-like lectin/glucanase domain-containing protein [Xylariaceae sp. FL0662B]